MEEILQQLDSHIQRLRPDFYKSLLEPLQEEEIQGIENQYCTQIPDDLKTFYQWKNGQASSCYDAFLNNSMFIPLKEALELAKELTSMIGTDFEIENWWNENWIPIFHNGGGSYICYDLKGIFTGNKGQILEFWNRDPDRNVIAGSLKHLLNSLNAYYTSQYNEELNEFISIEAHGNGFPKKFIVE
ncbi:benzoate transporter [Chryseobacterium phosphatilyticum]|uniref:Benzoate transporter n=1 Tax=Chryseobacterium phosphatilyticum TaxID=475075 RepID=A0A316XKV0_9FLAO|nr:SMI1/KNR4 family protein [Chryseobacterium phosphatilyticum]PWN71520.1 benzoate transporter [Chryseobacterium phosphatilyticum]